MKHPVFNDAALQKKFDVEGYVILDAFSEEEMKETARYMDELYYESRTAEKHIDSDYDLSFFASSAEYKARLREKVSNYFTKFLAETLADYEPLIVNLFFKEPGKGEVPIHQNWTFVDESQYTSVSIWMPLCDVNRYNGTLEVIPGSHTTLTPFRSPSIPWVFSGHEEDIKAKWMQPLTLKLGQIAILDDALLHYSGVNQSPEARPSIQLIMKPRAAQAIHYHRSKEDELTVHDVDATFFDTFVQTEVPKAPIQKVMPFEYHQATPDQINPLG